jgi:hypothetical protein
MTFPSFPTAISPFDCAYTVNVSVNASTVSFWVKNLDSFSIDSISFSISEAKISVHQGRACVVTGSRGLSKVTLP